MSAFLHESEVSRKRFLVGGGALVVGLSLTGAVLDAQAAKAYTSTTYWPPLGAYGPDVTQVDTWLSVNADNTVTLYTGVVELGTGSTTGLLQIAAEELNVPFSAMRLVTPDTLRTPDQFVSSGSRAISQHSPPIRGAAVTAYQTLLGLASTKLNVPVGNLSVTNGVVSGGGQQVTYSELVSGQLLNATIPTTSASLNPGVAPAKPISEYTIVGQSVPRIDFPAIVTGQFMYVQQQALHGTLQGRVVRPPTPGATLISVNGLKNEVPGFVKVVQKNDWLGVLAETEWAAIQAAKELDVTWSDTGPELPGDGDLHETMRNLPLYNAADNPLDLRGQASYIYPNPNVFVNTGNADAAIASAAKSLSVTYTSQFFSHGSIGPSAASALWEGDNLTVWTSTQTPYGTREALAKFWGLPNNNNVRLISQRGSGTYGQNGSDDAAFDASIMAQAVPGTPVHVQWMRSDEFQWENYKGARVTDMSGAVNASGMMVAWKNEDWGFTQYGRPEYHEPVHGGEAGSLVVAQLAGYDGPSVEEGGGPQPGSGYIIPNQWGQHNFLGAPSQRKGALRIKSGSMRNPGGYETVYVIESFVDELAALAGMDAIQFRLAHMTPGQATNVLQTAALNAGWQTRPSPNPSGLGKNGLYTGRGVAQSGNVAEIFEVTVNPKTGKVTIPRVTVATDRGLVINPTAVETQAEGGVVMGISEALYEGIRFNNSNILSRDWVSYPILRFQNAPGEINISIISDPNTPPAAVGEPQNEPVAAGLSNAIYDATGVRLRNLPFTPAVVRAELKAAGKA